MNDGMESLARERDLFRDRYLKLVELHGQLQSQNSLLEERLLTLVEKSSEEKMHLEEQLHQAKERIAHLESIVQELQIEKQRYKEDCQRAVQLLQRNPQEFLSHSNPPTSNPNHSFVLPTFPPTFIASFPRMNDVQRPVQNTESPSIPGLHDI